MDDIKSTIVGVAVALWFAQGWYLNEQLKSVHEKLNRTLEALNAMRYGLRDDD